MEYALRTVHCASFVLPLRLARSQAFSGRLGLSCLLDWQSGLVGLPNYKCRNLPDSPSGFLLCSLAGLQ